MKDYILIGKNSSDFEARLLLKYANRHGLITGATGTGKTVTLQTLAEGFSSNGIPVLMVDIKGDLQKFQFSGEVSKNYSIFLKKFQELGLDYQPKEFSACYWDCFAEYGIPIRTKISEIGPILLATILELNEVQIGILNIAFRVADEKGLLLIDIKDLRSLLIYLAEHANEFSLQYGNIASQSIASIQRALLTLEMQGGNNFIGEPSLELEDFFKIDISGNGIINVISAIKLINNPKLYSSFLMWLLSELYENLPEVGDLDKPKFVFFFDEAHLLFHDISKSLLQEVEKLVRLIRSKGVGIYFVTQNPIDIPDTILGQLANRIQHALRAFSPRDQKSVRVAAETFRQNPNINTENTITTLEVGEALISLPDEKGVPSIVERVNIIPPLSAQGSASTEELKNYLLCNPLYSKYISSIDTHSAYEVFHQEKEPLTGKLEEKINKDEESGLLDFLFKKENGRASVAETVIKSVARTVSSQIGRNLGKIIVRGILGSIKR